ncbi:unnamed protein product [Amaranthus hypochondriacus]
MGIEPDFPTKHHSQRKRQFDESDNEEVIQSPQEDFRVNYFLVLVDMAINSLNERFEQLTTFQGIFGFLCDSNKLKSLDGDALRACCDNFSALYSQNNVQDVDKDDLFSELRVLQKTLPDGLISAINILEFIKEADCFPNVSIACRILLTVPVTVALAERSFSKLKILKNYLRSSISQERLNGLAMLCIKKNRTESLDLDTVISDFASKNARRSIFV